MTEEEWEKQIERIAIAFGIPCDYSWESDIFEDDLKPNRTNYTCAFDSQDFQVSIFFHDSLDNWDIRITKRGEFLHCDGTFRDHRFSGSVGSWFLLPLLTRAIFLLGFDTTRDEKHPEVTFTAHEKLEWQLEFQRRLREETSQVE